MVIVQSVLARVAAVAGLCWAGLVVLAPFAPAAVAAATYAAAALVCHQRPERSFHTWGAHLPVCARCTGIYAGAALVCGAYLAGLWRPAARTSRTWRRGALLAGCVPTVVTVVIEWGGFAEMSSVDRAAAGLPLGIAAAAVMMAELNWVPRDAAGPLGPTRS